MANFDKQKVTIAAGNKSKLDLSSTHITTSSFLTLQPVYYRHMLPGETIKGNANVLSRLAPVTVPTYGRCRINLRAFFVPFRTVFPNFNEFITDTIGSNVSASSLVSGSPVVPNNSFVKLFTSGYSFFGVSLALPIVNPGDPYDFENGGTKYVLSFYGRHVMKILQSLGYRIIWEDKDQTDFLWSALPLLSFAKVYLDWYFNQAYLDSVSYLGIQQLLKYNDPTSSLSLGAGDVFNIVNVCFSVFYDNGNDVYVNSWDNPVAPNTGNFSSFNGLDITDPNASSALVSMFSNGTPYMQQGSNPSLGSQYLHDFLKSATDYVKRNQLSGALQIDRFLTRFGVNLDSAKANRSIYVSSQSIDIDFGSVMSTANSNGTPVGDYAGQGLGRGEFGFEFTSDEFGFFVVMSSIVPSAHLYQGADRNNFHIDKMQFFQPEFDNLGVQAIKKAEVYVSKNSSFGNALGYIDSDFGYAPRYYEYKQKSDFVTGDFVSEPAMIGGDSWHLNRILDDSKWPDVSYMHHSLDFTRGITDIDSYNRIFNYTGEDIDMFYLVYHFAVQSLAPCKSLFDTYDFDSAGDALSMNGNNAKVN